MPRPVDPTLQDVWEKAAKLRDSKDGYRLRGEPARLYSLQMALYKYRKRLTENTPSTFTDIINTLSITRKGNLLKIAPSNSNYADIEEVKGD